MDQSEGSPSMRGILSAGNWKILYSTPGRSSAKALAESAKNIKTSDFIVFSPQELQGDLGNPRVPCAANLTEKVALHAEVGLSELSVIEEIEELRPELQANALMDRKLFGERHVPVVDPRNLDD